MNAIIVAIVSALFTGVLSIILANKFTLSNSDLNTITKTFKCQKSLCLKIVETKDGEPIPTDEAEIQINLLLKDILENDELFLTISEETMLSLMDYKEDPSTENIFIVQKRLKFDFEETKYKLGYPNNILRRYIYYGMKIIQCMAIINIVLFLYALFHSASSSIETLIPLLYLFVFSSFVAVIIWPYFWNHDTYNKRFRKGVIDLFSQTLSKLLRWLKRLMHLK